MPTGFEQVSDAQRSGSRSIAQRQTVASAKLLLGTVSLALVLGCPSNSGSKAAPVPAPAVPATAAAPIPAPAATPAPPAAGVPAKRRPSAPALRVPARKASAPAPRPAPAASPASAPASIVVPSLLPVPTPPAAAVALPPPVPVAVQKPAPLPASPRPPTPSPVPVSWAGSPWAFGFQAALVFPSNGGLRTTAGTPSVSLGLHGTWALPKGLRLRPRFDYTVFAGATRSSTAAPLPQVLDTRVSSLALGADLLVPLGPRWSLGLAVAGVRWSVASTNTVTSTLGGSMTLSGTSHWTRLAVGPVLTFRVSDHLEVEGRALSSHYGYQNQPASTVTLGLLWRF